MDNSVKPPPPEPYLPVKAGDILLAENWHSMQVAARHELWDRIAQHSHSGELDGVRLDGQAVSADTLLTAGSLDVSGETTLASRLETAGDLEIRQAATLLGPVAAQSTLDVAGKLSARKELRVSTGSRLRSKLTVGGAASVRGNVTVRGRLIPSSIERGAFISQPLNLNLDTVDLSTIQAIQLTLTYGEVTGYDPVYIDTLIPYWEFDINTSFKYTSTSNGGTIENIQFVPKFMKTALVSWSAVPLNGFIHPDNTSLTIFTQGTARWPWTGQESTWTPIQTALKSWNTHQFLIHMSRQVPVFKITQDAGSLQLTLPVLDAKAVVRTRANCGLTARAQLLPYKSQLGTLNQQLKLDETTAALYTGDFSLAKTRWS